MPTTGPEEGILVGVAIFARRHDRRWGASLGLRGPGRVVFAQVESQQQYWVGVLPPGEDTKEFTDGALHLLVTPFAMKVPARHYRLLGYASAEVRSQGALPTWGIASFPDARFEVLRGEINYIGGVGRLVHSLPRRTEIFPFLSREAERDEQLIRASYPGLGSALFHQRPIIAASSWKIWPFPLPTEE